MENVPPILPNTRVLSAGSSSAERTRRPAEAGPHRAFSAGLALLDRRQRLEIGLNAADELVVVRRHDAELRLPLLALAQAPSIRADETLEPWPLRGDDDADADREQHDPRPTHGSSVPPQPVPQRCARVPA